MLEQIKELCLFMICGQTLLYFQSGKKYEKICRMILELLILAGVIGMILNFLQLLGFRKGEMEAAGGAVAGMQRSMEEALERQLDAEGMEEGFLWDDALKNLIKRHTLEEIKSRYNDFAAQYGFEIQNVKENGNKLQVFLKEAQKVTENAGNPAKIEEIDRVKIGEVTMGEEISERKGAEGHSEAIWTKKEELETFRRQLELVFSVKNGELEVILVD